jgi:hypothetical protein
MRKSTISIGYEDVGFFHQAKNANEETKEDGRINNTNSNRDEYLDKRKGSNIEEGERYQL